MNILLSAAIVDLEDARKRVFAVRKLRTNSEAQNLLRATGVALGLLREIEKAIYQTDEAETKSAITITRGAETIGYSDARPEPGLSELQP